jgi:hypothetical protein
VLPRLEKDKSLRAQLLFAATGDVARFNEQFCMRDCFFPLPPGTVEVVGYIKIQSYFTQVFRVHNLIAAAIKIG